ncbi:MAG TPA: hypothetical protein VKU85_11915, partial [bacterium]|nr:hypothetical protein [bacterium]
MKSAGSQALAAAFALAAVFASSCATSPAGEGPSGDPAAEAQVSPEEQMASARAALAENDGDA